MRFLTAWGGLSLPQLHAAGSRNASIEHYEGELQAFIGETYCGAGQVNSPKLAVFDAITMFSGGCRSRSQGAGCAVKETSRLAPANLNDLSNGQLQRVLPIPICHGQDNALIDVLLCMLHRVSTGSPMVPRDDHLVRGIYMNLSIDYRNRLFYECRRDGECCGAHRAEPRRLPQKASASRAPPASSFGRSHRSSCWKG
jgi:hypothetical protein